MRLVVMIGWAMQVAGVLGFLYGQTEAYWAWFRMFETHAM